MHLPALLALALQPAPTNALPYEEGEYSSVERHLDDAQEQLISAQTYICPDLAGPAGGTAARRRYDVLHRRFASLSDAARTQLGRQLNLDIWVNSCRIRNAGAAFQRHLRNARQSLNAAERLFSGSVSGN